MLNVELCKAYNKAMESGITPDEYADLTSRQMYLMAKPADVWRIMGVKPPELKNPFGPKRSNEEIAEILRKAQGGQPK